ncbi:MAG: hypothetical protein HGA75_07880 [Thiobacillus sp.]|nr:hypothetical protein [Thiobacillus sp.]
MPILSRLTASAQARRQRGAISIIAAVGLSAVIAAAALAVDLGSLFYTKRQLQSVADNAALSAVNDLAAAGSIALATAGQNDFAVPGDQANTLDTVVGHYDANTPSGDFEGTFTPGNSAGTPNAVQVTVTTQQPYFFLVGSREVGATATATRDDIAGFSIGSGLLSLDTSQSTLLNALLGKLLHSSISLDAVSYNGLANANVRLLDLVKVSADVGTLDELLKADIGLGELLRLTATALDRSDIATVDASVLNTLNLLALNVPGDLHLKLADLLNVSLADSTSAANAEINVLKLITLAAKVANQNTNNFLNLDTAINLPGILSLNLDLSLIEPPSIAIGPAGRDAEGDWRTQAYTAQARLKLDVTVLELLGGLVHLPIYIELASGNAWLQNVQCAAPRANSTVTIGATSGIAGIYVGEVNANAMTNFTTPPEVTPAKILDLLGLLTITAQAAIELPGGAGTLEFTGPFDQNNTQRIAGLSTEGLIASLVNSLELDTGGAIGSLLDLLIKLLLGMSLDDILKLVLQALTPVFSLLDALLNPVLSLLGLQLGYADVTAFYVGCGAPRLVR